ncbi:MFS transporter [Streptomyces sp. NPDC048279]|uniref:MFS transporter n=1 Tax=Streptomyces sp. NPDC048279 TaxID=3154714 RepID=UPI0034384B39
MAQLDFFIVNVALDGIGRSFPATTVAGVSWVLSAYAIVFAAVLVPAGRIADQWGRRKMLLAGVSVFTLTSAVAAAAPSLTVLVAARAVQAVGAAMIVPTSLGLLYPSFPKRQHTLVVGIWAGVAAIAASAGPPVGGLLVTLDWRWIFLINLPIGAVTFIAGRVLLPEVRQPKGAPLPDAASVVTLLGAVSLLVLGTVQAGQWGWTDTRTLALFAAAVLAGTATVERTLRAKSPVIEKQLFTSRPFTAATIALFLFFVGFAIVLLSTTLFLQEVWSFSPLRAGFAIAPAPLASIAFAMNAGPIQRRFGRTAPAVTGSLILALAAVYWLIAVHTTPGYWTGMFPGLILVGLAGGLAQAPLFAAAATLAPERATTGSAVLNMGRQIGSAVGVAVLVALAPTPTTDAFDHAWWVQASAGTASAAALLILQPRSTP